MLTLANIRRVFLNGCFSWEANFQKPPLLFEYEKLHDGHGNTLEDEFGMGDVKGVDSIMWRASHSISPVVSLRRVDPYWRSQLLVD